MVPLGHFNHTTSGVLPFIVVKLQWFIGIRYQQQTQCMHSESDEFVGFVAGKKMTGESYQQKRQRETMVVTR